MRGRDRMLGGVLAALGVLLVFGYWFVMPRDVREPGPPVMVDSAEPSGLPFPSVAPPPGMDVRAVLRVHPPDAGVTVEGVVAEVSDGRVTLEAPPGETVEVAVAVGDAQMVREVVVTATGKTHPERLVFGEE